MNLLLLLSSLLSAAVAIEYDLPWQMFEPDYELYDVNGQLNPDPHYEQDKADFEAVKVRDTVAKDNSILKAIRENKHKLLTSEGITELCYKDLWNVTKTEGSEVFKSASSLTSPTYPKGRYFLCYGYPWTMAPDAEKFAAEYDINTKFFDGGHIYHNGHGHKNKPCEMSRAVLPFYYGWANSWIDGTVINTAKKTNAYIKVPNLSMDELRDISRIPGMGLEYKDIWFGVSGLVNNPYKIHFMMFPLEGLCPEEESETPSALRGSAIKN